MKQKCKALSVTLLAVLYMLTSGVGVMAAAAESMPPVEEPAISESSAPESFVENETAPADSFPDASASTPASETESAPEDDSSDSNSESSSSESTPTEDEDDTEEDAKAQEEAPPFIEVAEPPAANTTGWYTEGFDLAIKALELEKLQKLEVLYQGEPTLLYPAEEEPEADTSETAEPESAPAEPASPEEPVDEWTFPVGGADAADGVHQVEIYALDQDGNEVRLNYTFRMDLSTPGAPGVEEEPAPQGMQANSTPTTTLHLTAESGPSGHVFWMSRDNLNFVPLASDEVTLTEFGLYYFKSISGAGLESAVSSFQYAAQDTTTPVPGWGSENGRWFYLNDQLQRVLGWQTIDGGAYYFDTLGYTLVGKQMVVGSTYYFDPNRKGERKSGLILVEGRHYYFAAQDGVMQTGFIKAGEVLYYGDPASGALHNQGWLTLDGEKYYSRTDCALVQGAFELDGDRYFFQRDTGRMLKGLIADTNNDKYYADKETGVLQTGLIKVGSKKYLFANNGKAKSGPQKIKGKYYFFEIKTKAMKLRGWAKDGNKRYYVNKSDNTLLTGAQKIGKDYYFFNKKGLALAGKRKVDGMHTFYSRTTFARAKGLHNDNGKRYYLDKKTGEMHFGWKKIGKYDYFFDKKTGIAATGKRKIDGKMYRFDDKGRLQGETKEEDEDIDLGNSKRGIDVSSWQGKIDWAAVASSGDIDFAIMRALTWSNAAGGYVLDSEFDYNIRNAKKHGIKVGVYLFSYAFTSAEMVQEVDFFANHPTVKAQLADGIKYDLPVFIDYEYEKVIERNPSYEGRTQSLRDGLVRLKQHGFTPGFYSSHSWAVSHYNATALQSEGYDFWYARYYSNTPDKQPSQHGWTGSKPLAIWQYTSRGTVPGIKGNVDMNYSYKNYKAK